MKQINVPLEADYWASEQINSPLVLIDAFFTYDNLPNYKKMLKDLISYSCKTSIYKQEYPGQVFILYLSLRSLVRACYSLQFKANKWKGNNSSRTHLLQGTLTDEEFNNPFLVLQNVFREFSIQDFDFFLSECVHLCLSPYLTDFNCNADMLLQHLLKIMGAAKIIQSGNINNKN